MAITRSQQARQMLKAAGAVEQDGVLNYIKNSESVTVPKEFKARKGAPATKLAYITAAEAKMLKKKKPGTPHKGPKGIPSYDSYGSIDASGKDVGMSGVATSAAEAGGGSGADRKELESYISRDQMTSTQLPPGVTRQLPSDIQDYRSAFIAAGGGQRVNPGFFDSRNVISPEELRRAREYANRPDTRFAKGAMRRTRGGGLLGFLTSGGLLGNLVRGLGQRFGLGKKFNEPTYDMRQFSDIGLLTDRVNPNNLDIYNEFVDDEDDTNVLPKMILPKRKPDTQGLLEVPGIETTPFQKDILETPQQQADDDIFEGAMAKVTGLALAQKRNLEKKKRMEDFGGPKFTDEDQKTLDKLNEMDASDEIFYQPVQTVADGGMIGGGIMDAAGRQQYFLGKLVKKATRAVKKIVKSPVGKLGLLAAGGFGLKSAGLLSKLYTGGKLTGLGKLALGAGISAAPLIFGQEEEEQPTGFTGSVGGQIDPRAYTDPYGVLFGAFKAEGGSMKDEPVAKRTMPLLDMGGQEMDLRAEGGFVPIGRMEKADDVPARLSKNEFVFTADAVRNAGDGDVDKGAEVMYNMMKNLEAGGDVSEESQGLKGAREMFQTAKRLEDVV